MVKDKRVKTVKLLIEADKIKSLAEIFEHIPVTTVALFLGTNFERLTDRINNPGKFRFSEAVQLAGYFEVDEHVMIEIVYRQVVLNRTKRKKK